MKEPQWSDGKMLNEVKRSSRWEACYIYIYISTSSIYNIPYSKFSLAQTERGEIKNPYIYHYDLLKCTWLYPESKWGRDPARECARAFKSSEIDETEVKDQVQNRDNGFSLLRPSWFGPQRSICSGTLISSSFNLSPHFFSIPICVYVIVLCAMWGPLRRGLTVTEEKKKKVHFLRIDREPFFACPPFFSCPQVPSGIQLCSSFKLTRIIHLGSRQKGGAKMCLCFFALFLIFKLGWEVFNNIFLPSK